MAYDKVVDSAALEQGLTKVADAIRDKTGDADALSFPDGMVESLTGASAAKLFRQNMINYCKKQRYMLQTIKDGTTTLKNCGYWDYRWYWTTMPNSVTQITYGSCGCFEGCQNVLFDKLSDNLTSIGNSAFSGCTNLALTSLPEGLTSIGNSAFQTCTNLALTSLPEGLTSIGNSAFYYNNYDCITEIPASVKTIGERAFHRAFNSASLLGFKGVLTFKGTPDSIGANAFNYNGFSLKTINVPWAEGAVANAPWGFSGTINYNYTGG